MDFSEMRKTSTDYLHFHRNQQQQYVEIYLDVKVNIANILSPYTPLKECHCFFFVSFSKLVTGRPGWERRAIALPHTRHIKDTRVVCCAPKTLYGVFSQLFLIHSFSTLLITLFSISLVKSSVQLYSTFNLLFIVQKITFTFSYSCYLLNTHPHS